MPELITLSETRSSRSSAPIRSHLESWEGGPSRGMQVGDVAKAFCAILIAATLVSLAMIPGAFIAALLFLPALAPVVWVAMAIYATRQLRSAP